MPTNEILHARRKRRRNSENKREKRSVGYKQILEAKDCEVTIRTRSLHES